MRITVSKKKSLVFLIVLLVLILLIFLYLIQGKKLIVSDNEEYEELTQLCGINENSNLEVSCIALIEEIRRKDSEGNISRENK